MGADMRDVAARRDDRTGAGRCILNLEKCLQRDFESSDQSCKIQLPVGTHVW